MQLTLNLPAEWLVGRSAAIWALSSVLYQDPILEFYFDILRAVLIFENLILNIIGRTGYAQER